GPDRGTMEDDGVVEATRLPVFHGSADVEHVGTADHLLHGTETQARHVLADLLRDEVKEGLHELRLARELRAEFGILAADSHPTGVEMTHAHHDAAHDHEGRGGE